MSVHQLIPKTKSATKRYHLLKVNNEPQLFCREYGEWSQDLECRSINEMLQAGLIGESTVRGWIAAQVGGK